MSVTYDDRKRQAVPRCLSYETACLLGLLRVSRRQEGVHRNEVKDSDASRQWTENPRTSTAVDLVGEALILKDFESSEAVKAAEYILRKGYSSGALVGQLATHFLEEIENVSSILRDPKEIPDRDSRRMEIARLKRSVRNYPVNAIAWSDLSLSYATLGQGDKAKEAMNIAMSLAKGNRFVLRSASRCFLHFEEPDRAVDILNKSGLCAIDPWIASAEIAIAESKGLKSKCIRRAKDLIEDDNLTAFSRGELAASLGTIEIKNGSIKRAKKIMSKAIMDPTENALAQVEWASSIHDIDFNDMIELRRIVPASYEATAVHAYYSKEFAESLKESKKWGRFQFLSSRPIIHSTFIASSMLNDDSAAIDIFDNALPVQRNSALAVNNYAFSLARVGRTKEAGDRLDEWMDKASNEEKLVFTATMGLVCFREGDVEGGRRLYNTAVNGFELLKNGRSASIAKYYWAVEEKRIRSENAESRIREAKRAIEQNNVFGFEDLAKKL